MLALKFRFKFLRERESCKFLLRNLARVNNQLRFNIEEINNLAEHFVYEHNFEKLLLASSLELVVPYETFIYSSPMPKFYQLEYINQFNSVNIDVSSGIEVKKANNANSKFSQIFQDRLENVLEMIRTVIFTAGSRTEIEGKSNIGMAGV